jgi:hypothetical protein
MIRTATAILVAVSTSWGCAASTVQSTSETRTPVQRANPSGAELSRSSVTIDGVTIERLRKEWATEFVEAVGRAPLVEKYPGESARNRALTREGAKVKAQEALYSQIGTIQITSTTTVIDFVTTAVSQSMIRGEIRELEEVSGGWIKDREGAESYEVRLRMPKIRVLRVIEDVRQR